MLYGLYGRRIAYVLPCSCMCRSFGNDFERYASRASGTEAATRGKPRIPLNSSSHRLPATTIDRSCSVVETLAAMRSELVVFPRPKVRIASSSRILTGNSSNAGVGSVSPSRTVPGVLDLAPVITSWDRYVGVYCVFWGRSWSKGPVRAYSPVAPCTPLLYGNARGQGKGHEGISKVGTGVLGVAICRFLLVARTLVAVYLRDSIIRQAMRCYCERSQSRALVLRCEIPSSVDRSLVAYNMDCNVHIPHFATERIEFPL